MLKVLWFEVTVPGRYKNDGIPVGGWQDSLECIVRKHSDIKLYIAFEGKSNDKRKIIDGIEYIPIIPHYSLFERLKSYWTQTISREHLLRLASKIVRKIKPDIIHIFGSEWCWGQIQLFTSIPVVIHMQGALPAYFNAQYPPGYSNRDVMASLGFNIISRFKTFLKNHKNKTWIKQEEKTFSIVNNYMGRTSWDKNMVNLFNRNAHYFYCSEALRHPFIFSKEIWFPKKRTKIRIVTTGVSTFWKGIDTLLRTACILKNLNVDFEWICAGNMNQSCKRLVEYKEHDTFKENNIKIAGFLNPYQLKGLLLSADIYVHTAYIDNSPNAICEAQCLGLPIIATYVGGIPSLIENKVDGYLVPANDPFTMASKIMKLCSDKDLCMNLGLKAREHALLRHDEKSIYRDLLNCYTKILQNNYE